MENKSFFTKAERSIRVKLLDFLTPALMVCEKAFFFFSYKLSVARIFYQKQLEFKVPEECKEIAKVSLYNEIEIWNLAQELDYDYAKVRIFISALDALGYVGCNLSIHGLIRVLRDSNHSK